MRTRMIEAETNQDEGGPAMAGKRPTHVAYWVRERGEDRKAEWHRVGIAWSHADGKGITIHLDLHPRDGRITLRTIEDQKE